MLLTATTLMDDIDSAVESQNTPFLIIINGGLPRDVDEDEDDDHENFDCEYSDSEDEEGELNRTLNNTLDLSRHSVIIDEPPTAEEALEQVVKVYTTKETRCAAHVIQQLRTS